MKKIIINIWAVIRWLFLGILFLIMYILGILLFPINYGFRKWIRKYKIPFFWWFLDSSEKDLISNTYGDQGWRDKNGYIISEMGWLKKSFVAFRWSAIRNSHWNFKLLVAPRSGLVYYSSGDIIIKRYEDPYYNKYAPLTFCNADIFGLMFSFYNIGSINGPRYFRFSFSIICWFFGIKIWNVQIGSSNVRYVYKSKFTKYSKSDHHKKELIRFVKWYNIRFLELSKISPEALVEEYINTD